MNPAECLNLRNHPREPSAGQRIDLHCGNGLGSESDSGLGSGSESGSGSDSRAEQALNFVLRSVFPHQKGSG